MTYAPLPGDRCRLPSDDIVTVTSVDGDMVSVRFESGSVLAVSVTLLEPV